MINIFLPNYVQAVGSEDWHKTYCSEECQVKGDGKLATTLSSLTSLKEQSHLLQKDIDSKVKNWSDFMKWPGGNDDFWKKEYYPRFFQMEDEANAILQTNNAIDVLERKLDICRVQKVCGAGPRVELEKEDESLIEIRSHLTKSSPWWVSDGFGKLAEKT